jgi:hypothetical protein
MTQPIQSTPFEVVNPPNAKRGGSRQKSPLCCWRQVPADYQPGGHRESDGS